ncbi:ATP-independent chaperone, alpha-crystallin/Hsp20 family [Candidatus Moduliflexus flocculans]|uniref:ATP-independent chaperone, alpha-crystallin/Hsp20 family n=1 Tax=Candidatus Moduliflexus flocculans TaxID=1499966 RepID=A0A081BRC0_9BACT|nr:ATP-independent chaperone, alpha-crystallin/Hsp20 family [Candidatus Moduliflexus flocculans]
MPVLVQWNPINNLFALDEHLTRMFDHASECVCGRKIVSQADWQPSADMYETEEAIIIHAELAGIDKSSLSITFQDGYLIIQGNRPLNREMQSAKILRVEQMYGTFERAFLISASVNAEQITAAYEYGVLNVTLPKKPDHSGQQVTVPIAFISS